jgi:hypothetical protein
VNAQIAGIVVLSRHLKWIKSSLDHTLIFGGRYMDDRRLVIVQKFARWAAASAARQGSPVRGRAWYAHIDQVHIKDLLSDKSPTADSFARWHRAEVERLGGNARVPIGWAAKIVNMLTKVHVYVAGSGAPELRGLIHPPIDNFLVNAILKRYSAGKQTECTNRDEIVQLCSMGKPIRSVTTYGRYLKVIEGLKMVAEFEGWTLFETESLWDDATAQSIRRGQIARDVHLPPATCFPLSRR